MEQAYPVSDDPIEIAYRLLEMGCTGAAQAVLLTAKSASCPTHPDAKIGVACDFDTDLGDHRRLLAFCKECNRKPEIVTADDIDFLCHPV